jgi:hypothetical protein
VHAVPSDPTSTPGLAARASRLPLLLAAAIAGVLVGSVVVGAVWILTDDDTVAVDTTPIAAPERLGPYRQVGALTAGQGGAAVRNAKRTEAWNARTAEAVSRAYGGAAAVAATYADDGLETMIPVTAVRAATPEPFVPYQDPAELGLARPTSEVTRFDRVACVLHNDPTASGEEPDPQTVWVTSCMRSGPGLTVQIVSPGGGIAHQPQQVAGLVDEMWASVAPDDAVPTLPPAPATGAAPPAAGRGPAPTRAPRAPGRRGPRRRRCRRAPGRATPPSSTAAAPRRRSGCAPTVPRRPAGAAGRRPWLACRSRRLRPDPRRRA